MRGLLSISLIIFFTSILLCQDLPADSLLYNSLANHYQSLLSADLKEIDLKKKKSWTKYLPSIGLTYTVSGSPRPSLGYNPLSILAVNEGKELLELKRSAIVMRYENLLYSEFVKLENLILDYKADLKSIDQRKRLKEIDDKLMEMAEEKYNLEMIKPSQYLAEKKKHLEMEIALTELEDDLQKRVNQIYNTAKLSRTNLSRFLLPLE